MILKKQYIQPKIDQIEIDVTISLQNGSEETPPGGDGPFGVESTTDSEKVSSFDDSDDSGIKENPFRR